MAAKAVWLMETRAEVIVEVIGLLLVAGWALLMFRWVLKLAQTKWKLMHIEWERLKRTREGAGLGNVFNRYTFCTVAILIIHYWPLLLGKAATPLDQIETIALSVLIVLAILSERGILK